MMSSSELQEAGRAEREAPSQLRESSWSVSLTGIQTVAALELKQRVRSRWWVITIVVWMAVLAALTLLIQVTVVGENGSARAGATMFGIIGLLVLSLASLISPALSATSINGDRAQGVLAAMQASLLTPAEIVLGKLAAAWVSALSLVASALPFFAWAFLLGGTSGARLIVTIVMISLTLLVVCAIGLGCSALVNRTSASSAQTYLLVSLLGIGLPLLFLLSLAVVQDEVVVTAPAVTYGAPDAEGNSAASCALQPETRTITHTEYTWWLLAASPYVVVADAAPAPPGLRNDDIFSEIRNGVRAARLGPSDRDPRTCAQALAQESGNAPYDDRRDEADRLGPSWPYGLAIDLLIGAGFTTLAIRRLRVPAARLPTGTRVA